VNDNHKKNGALILIEALVKEGVNQCFGYPGGAVIPFYDALCQYNKETLSADNYKKELRHWRTTHEQHALHAADGYARATGKVGVAIVTSGPGATNSITGLANAYMDSIPLVVIAGQVSRRLIGRDAFQEVDITGIVTPITKHSFTLQSASEIASIISSAFEIACSGRKGPVLVEIPKDILTEVPIAQRPPQKRPKITQPPINYYQLQKASDALRLAKRPVIYAGGGTIAAQASTLLLQLAKCLHAPVVNSLMGLGSIPRNHPLSLGLVGMHGSAPANIALSRADVILALGVRFSDRVLGKPCTFAPQATLIRVDLDPTEHDKNVAEDHLLQMDIKEALKLLLKRFDPQQRNLWHKEISLYEQPLRRESVLLERCFKALSTLVKDAYVATDVGQHQMWTAQYFPFSRPRQWLTSGGLGTMGFGVGALLGSLFSNEQRDGIPLLVTGDGSLRMSMMELLSLKQLGIPVIILVLNNGSLGMVRQWQQHFCDSRFQDTTVEDGADLALVARAMGIQSITVEDPETFIQVLDTLHLPLNKPLLIDLHIPSHYGAYPFVPPDSSLDAMIF